MTTAAPAAGELAAVRDGDVWRFDVVGVAPHGIESTEVAPEPDAADDPSATVAAAIPVEPPAEWFDDPGLGEPTALTVTADGRVYGHAAAWGVRHIGLPGCRTAPRSQSGYRYYRTGQVQTADGSMVATGRITLGTGHADLAGNLTAASEHYDNTGAAVADVAVGEDAHGIWFAGALRPDVTPAQVRALRASSLSGDWRPAGRNLEMVGLLAVNVPGFPTPRAALAASGHEVAALVAAGVVLRPAADELDWSEETTPEVDDEPLTAATDSSTKGGEGSSSFDEDKHPRDGQGQWAPKDEDGKKAQGDAGAKANYAKLEGGTDADSAAMLKGLSDDDLRKLTAFAYSSKTSDPRIVKARNRVANEMGKRGLDIKKHGARGGGKKGATRASADPTPGGIDMTDATETDDTGELEPTDADTVTAAGDGGASFSDGDRVTLGDTGVSGSVTGSNGEDVTVSVTVPASMLSHDQEATAASADPTVVALQTITASLTAITERLDRQDAERRSERGAAILEGLPG